MGAFKNPNRRGFIIGNLCAAAGLCMTISTGASAQILATPGQNSGTIQAPSLSANSWETVAEPEFKVFKRQYFHVLTDDNRPIRLRLLKIIPGNSGPNRPKHLRRREGLIAVFNTSKANCDWFVKNGHQSVNIWHHALGNSRVFLGAVPSPRGGHKIEMVLN